MRIQLFTGRGNRAAMLLTLLLSLTGLSALAGDSDAELEVVRANLATRFNALKPGDVSLSPIEGWYEIRQGSMVAYVSGDGKFLMQGDIIDLDSQINITEAARTDARRELMDDVAESSMIVFSPENKKHSITVFTDIDCVYCRRLHSQINDYMARGIEVRYLMYLRSGPNSPSWKKAERVWCAEDRNKAMTLAKLDQKFSEKICADNGIAAQYALGQQIGLRGTPAIITSDGELLSGYVPAPELSAALNKPGL